MAKGPLPCRSTGRRPFMKACASISRVLYPDKSRSPPSIWPRRCRRDLSTYPPDPEMLREDGLSTFRQYGTPGIHGLSAREVYQAALSPGTLVGSYFQPPKRPIPREGGPTFSSLPRRSLSEGGPSLQLRRSAVSLSAALSMAGPSPSRPLPVRKHAALRCPDFPPRTLRHGAAERCTGYQRTFTGYPVQ